MASNLTLKDIVVIDDKLEDLYGITFALAQEGHSTIPLRYDSDANILDVCTKIEDKSIRLIILDMELQVRDFLGTDTTDEDVKLATSIINSLFGEDSQQLYALLIWTTHPDRFENYIDKLYKRLETLNKPLPLFSNSLLKEKCKKDDNNDEYDVDKILKSFEEFFENRDELIALLDWENQCFYSAKETINSISESNDSEEIKKTLTALAHQSLHPSQIKNKEKYAVAESLKYLLNDKLSYSIESIDNDLWAKTLLSTVTELENLSKINTLLHLDFTNLESEMICPGDFFKINDDLLWSYFTDETGERLAKFKRAIFYKNFKNKDKDGNSTNNLQKEISDNAIFGLLEISPSCDFAQGKRKECKMYVFAILSPYKEELINSDSPSIIGKKIFNIKDSDFTFFINSNYIFTIPDKIIIEVSEETNEKNLSKIFRIRESLLLPLIREIANQNSRIGTIIL